MNAVSRMAGACLAALLAHTTADAASFTVTVNADGTYSPQWLDIHDGDSVTWEFPDRRRAIVRVHPDGTNFPA